MMPEFLVRFEIIHEGEVKVTAASAGDADLDVHGRDPKELMLSATMEIAPDITIVSSEEIVAPDSAS